MSYATVIDSDKSIHLGSIDCDGHGGLDRARSKEELDLLTQEIQELQELMFAARSKGLLIVFQGRDTAGKDGAINKVLEYINVQSCHVASFKAPTAEELAHDFLWRVHPHTPAKGGVSIFNRSHYEDIIAVRAHDLAPDSVWKRRYEEINAFEDLLLHSNTIILKFFLHISKDEQKERLIAREQDPLKAWKLNVGDWKERELWDKIENAYDDVLNHCSRKNALWQVIPANHKWFRDLAVAEAIRDALKPYRKEWKEALEKIGKKALAELKAYREEG